MTRGFSRRGQPLAVLTMVLGCWVSARVMLWDASAMPLAASGLLARASVANAPAAMPAQSESAAAVAMTQAAVPVPEAAMALVPKAARSLGATAQKFAGKVGMATAYEPAYQVMPAYTPAFAPRPRSGLRIARAIPAKFAAAAPHRASGPIVFQQQYAAPGWAQRLTPQGDARFTPASSSALSSVFFPTVPGSPYVHNASAAQTPPARAHRWSADGWYYWRHGSSAGLSPGAFAPSYGASQAGGVLRYRFALSSGYKPTAFLRTTAALNGSGEREAALGLSARPMPRVPIVVAGEARYSQTPNGKEVRPAGFAYTELPSFRLPLGMRGELYAQGGYVGGKDATAFVDGQLRADHKLAKPGKAEVRVGGGIWGGAQKGAARLDAGPSIIVVSPIGNKLFARLAADWRFRVAGDAAPDSGPAVTLSAGF